MKPLKNLLIIFMLSIVLGSCDRIKDKTKHEAKKIKEGFKEEVQEQSRRVIDKVFPPFDHGKPDTENNKKRFIDFLKVEVSPDVKNIYCFDDAIGIDTDYMFSFNCNVSTSNKIIEMHKLSLDTINHDNGFGIQHDFEWWDKERISKLPKYSWTNGKNYFKYYWYDNENNKAYFFDFDL